MEITYSDLEVLDLDPPGPAPFLQKVINAEDRSLLGGIWDMVIDPSIGVSAGVQLSGCELASPKPDPRDNPDARCISVPRHLETEAKDYDSGAKKVGGLPRYDWTTQQLSTITHEKNHFLLDKSSGPLGPGKTFDVQNVHDFSPDIFHFDLGEMNSILSEFSVQYDRAPKDARDRVARKFLIGYINSPGESIRGILKKVRCIATCDEVNDGVKKVFAFQSSMWSVKKTELFLKIVRDPDLHLDWPK